MKRKFQIFKEYYLKWVILALVLVVGLIFFCSNQSNKKQNRMQIMIMGVQYATEAEAAFEEEIADLLGLDKQKEYADIAGVYTAEQLMYMLLNAETDILIMDATYFESMVSEELLSPLDPILGEEMLQARADDLVTGEDGAVYGISVSDAPWTTQLEMVSTDDMIIGITDGGPNPQNAQALLKLLLEE